MDAAAKFPAHLQEGTEKARQVEVPEGPFSSAVVIGMGGSSIGGALAVSLLRREAEIPITVVRDHTIPGSVDDETLVVATSYSGQTHETLDAVQDAVHRGASLAAITTGGRLGYLAEEADAPAVMAPTGFQPRAALGFLFSANYTLLSRALGVGDPERIERAAKRLEPKLDDLADPDGPIGFMAGQLDDGTVGVVGHDVLGVVARRVAGQLNENAKRLAFHETMPEMCHNQIIGWNGNAGNATLILVRRDDESNLEGARMSFLSECADDSGCPVVDIRVHGETMDQALEGCLVGDHLSLHLARMEGTDPEPVDTIDQLKSRIRGWT